MDSPTATIDLEALTTNLRTLKSRLHKDIPMLAAVKADAYGHGATFVARRLESLGVTWFGVATAQEALELRHAGLSARILLFGPVLHGIDELAANDVTLVIADKAHLDAIRRQRASVRVHLKVDTGMGRLGHSGAAAAELAREVALAPNITLEGVWTHLARADEPESSHTERQLDVFDRLLATLASQGIEPELRHVANSAGFVAHPKSQYDLVRPGIGLYGYHASRHIEAIEPGLIPVMTVSAPVTFVKRVTKGTSVSYGGTWSAPRDSTVATVRFGYADGYLRLLGNLGSVNLRGQLSPVVGRVCMDQLMIDAADVDVAIGERVVLFGPLGPTAQDLADKAGTIAYELLTSVSPRVQRVYEG